MDEGRTPLAAFLAILQAQASADPGALYARLPALRTALGLADEPDAAEDEARHSSGDEAELEALEAVAEVKALNVSLLRLVPHLIEAEGSDEPEDNLLRIEAKLAGAKAALYMAELRERYGMGDDNDPEAA